MTPKPYSIELHFDDASTTSLVALWSRLQTIYGSPRRSELGTQPHVTLVVLDEAPAGVEAILEPIIGGLRPLELSFDGVDQFDGDEGVVFLAVTKTPGLRQMHEALCTLLRRQQLKNSKWYEPDVWRPHCTIATDVSREMRPAVMTAAQDGWPRQVRVTNVCGVSYRPATVRFRRVLTDSPSV